MYSRTGKYDLESLKLQTGQTFQATQLGSGQSAYLFEFVLQGYQIIGKRSGIGCPK